MKTSTYFFVAAGLFATLMLWTVRPPPAAVTAVAPTTAGRVAAERQPVVAREAVAVPQPSAPTADSDAEPAGEDYRRAAILAKLASLLDRQQLPDLSKGEPTTWEENAFGRYRAHWMSGEEAPDKTLEIQREIADLFAEFDIKPDLNDVSCRGDMCRLRFTFASIAGLQTLERIPQERFASLYVGPPESTLQGQSIVIFAPNR